MLTGPVDVLSSSTNSSLPLAPRNWNSEMTTPFAEANAEPPLNTASTANPTTSKRDRTTISSPLD
jgi:hypothetical protein